jgi:hypothetical protein
MRDLDTVRQTIASPVVAALFDAPFAPIFIIVSFPAAFLDRDAGASIRWPAGYARLAQPKGDPEERRGRELHASAVARLAAVGGGTGTNGSPRSA